MYILFDTKTLKRKKYLFLGLSQGKYERHARGHRGTAAGQTECDGTGGHVTTRSTPTATTRPVTEGETDGQDGDWQTVKGKHRKKRQTNGNKNHLAA